MLRPCVIVVTRRVQYPNPSKDICFEFKSLHLHFRAEGNMPWKRTGGPQYLSYSCIFSALLSPKHIAHLSVAKEPSLWLRHPWWLSKKTICLPTTTLPPSPPQHDSDGLLCHNTPKAAREFTCGEHVRTISIHLDGQIFFLWPISLTENMTWHALPHNCLSALLTNRMSSRYFYVWTRQTLISGERRWIGWYFWQLGIAPYLQEIGDSHVTKTIEYFKAYARLLSVDTNHLCRHLQYRLRSWQCDLKNLNPKKWLVVVSQECMILLFICGFTRFLLLHSYSITASAL